ncbi:Hypothetical protein Bdt_1860 [Bdellovibrio bacteriovorus str. Tiberius]|uniref:Uncharacterized protein n=1 Tax=Bdellovibrio bacteriovorus str. Tiberius TaxID=1069642 RepID=K7ZFI9_BDEBC|nr:Hypothetical protein Bdt_1860 [Bdellovibrio bacteriovorus str. Tiberius]
MYSKFCANEGGFGTLRFALCEKEKGLILWIP